MTIGARPAQLSVSTRDGGPQRLVAVSMIADTDYLALARTVAMHVGALLALPLSKVADLRLAVSEACARFLDTPARREPDAFGADDFGADDFGAASAPDVIELAYDKYPGELHVTVRAAAGENWPGADELDRALLGALVGDVRVRVRDGFGELTLIQPLPMPLPMPTDEEI